MVEVSAQPVATILFQVRAKAQHHKFLIGKNGTNIKKIRDSTGAKICFPSNLEDDPETITIIGKKEAVADAKKQLEAMIKGIVSNLLAFLTCLSLFGYLRFSGQHRGRRD